MSTHRDLPPQLLVAVLKGEMTPQQAYNEYNTPTPQEVERMLDGKPAKEPLSYTAWPRQSRPVERCGSEPQHELQRLVELEKRISELEVIVVMLAEQIGTRGAE
jgi:hypothetical protein